MAGKVDFNLPNYIAKKYGEAAARLQSGSAYAYSGERRMRSGMLAAKPVLLGLTAATRSWVRSSRPRLLENAEKLTRQRFGHLSSALAEVSDSLGFNAPVAYIHTDDKLGNVALGATLDCALWLYEPQVNELAKDVLKGVLASLCADIQNDHVPFVTAKNYLDNDASLALRMAAKPAALFLSRWRKRALVTCDRATMIATRDLAVSMRAVAAMEGQSDIPSGDWTESRAAWQAHGKLGTRAKALELFAGSVYYQTLTGGSGGKFSSQQLDEEVASVLGAF